MLFKILTPDFIQITQKAHDGLVHRKNQHDHGVTKQPQKTDTTNEQ